jgi:hypothetical protein
MTLTVETWCGALESGKYQQGRGKLRDDDAHCCLGVACDLSGEGEWEDSVYRITERCGSSTTLPGPLRDLLSLASTDGRFIFDDLPMELQVEIYAVITIPEGDGPPDSLVDLNDYGVAFPLIAKVIRARPKGLFREDAP